MRLRRRQWTPSAPHAWLAQAVYYLTYRAGGLPLLVGLNTALLVAALLPVYLLCLEGAGGRVRLGAVAALLPATVLAAFGSMRPQVFSFPMLAYFLWVLVGYRASAKMGTGTASCRANRHSLDALNL